MHNLLSDNESATSHSDNNKPTAIGNDTLERSHRFTRNSDKYRFTVRQGGGDIVDESSEDPGRVMANNFMTTKGRDS